MRNRTILKSVACLLFLFSIGYGSALDRIMEKHAQALGGMERLKSVKSFKVRGIVKLGGLEGTITEWGKSPDKYREEVDLQILKQERGTDGHRFWKVDQNNKLAELQGREKEDLITSCCLSNFCYLLPSTREDVTSYLGKSSRKGRSYYLLSLTLWLMWGRRWVEP